jgi:hypothetical protein
VNKKNQKNFLPIVAVGSGYPQAQANGKEISEVFLLLFVHKKKTLVFLQNPLN